MSGSCDYLGVPLALMPRSHSCRCRLFLVFLLVIFPSAHWRTWFFLACWLFGHPIQLVLGSFALATLIIWRHRPNMRRLLAGEEFKIGQRVKEKN